MEDKRVSTTYINAIKQMYRGTKSKIKIGSDFSEEFKVNKGLRQGCCISPTLFKIYIDKALKIWRRKCAPMGVRLEEETIYSLLFADDQVILAEDEDDAKYMLRKLVDEFNSWGLEINFGKTQYMVIGGQGHDLIIEEGLIKHTNEYKYLGVTITADGRDNTDIRKKITKGKIVVKQLHPVLWNDNISLKTKKRMFKTFVESTVTYGAEVWTVENKIKDTISTVEMMYWRRCCKKTLQDRVRNERIKEIMHVDTSLIDEIEKKQLVWYGHMRRMNEERLPQKVWKWKPKARRKRGRPRKSWKSQIEEAMQKRQLEEALIPDKRAWRLGCGKRP